MNHKSEYNGKSHIHDNTSNDNNIEQEKIIKKWNIKVNVKWIIELLCKQQIINRGAKIVNIFKHVNLKIEKRRKGDNNIEEEISTLKPKMKKHYWLCSRHLLLK